MYTCEICGEEFENAKIKANHVRWKHKAKKDCNKKISEKAIARYVREYGEYIKKSVACENCGVEFEITERAKVTKDHYFCSRSCANSRSHSDETKDLISKSITEAWKTNTNLQNTLRNHIKNRYFSSKNEVLIRETFMKKFTTDEWTFGGSLIFDNLRLSRDLYSKKLKVCIEYDGIWHFKDIHGQLKDKQAKDKALEEWCIENDYRLIRISEEYFIKDPDANIKKLITECYQGSDQIVKFY